jgi:hypothetical protein
MANVWKSFWVDLNTPESYPDDPYKAFINQVFGHALGVGGLGSILICVIYEHTYGEFPYRIAVWFGLVSFYFFIVEGHLQKWRKDFKVDTLFVALGAAIPMTALYEVQIEPTVRLEYTKEWFYITTAILFIVGLLHIYPRAVKKYSKED